MSKAAFATYEQVPQLTDDDRLVAAELRDRGITVQAAIWDAPNVDWLDFDRVIIRSTWDYHLKPRLHERWLVSFAEAPERLWNAPSVVRTNLDKSYLMKLSEKGVAVVPTAYVGADHSGHVARNLTNVL